MRDLLFTRPGDVYPFPLFVRVSVDGDEFIIRLFAQEAGVLNVIEEQRSSKENAAITLNSLLVRVVAT